MRNDVELLRIISAFGIVWFHSGSLPGREIAYGGLIFFIIISSYFANISKRQNKPLERIKRLIVPCVIWTIPYSLLNFVRLGQICPENYSFVSCIFSTPSPHLWYLPYMCIVLILIDRAKLIFSQSTLGLFSGTMAVILMMLAPKWREFSYIDPFDLYAHALPAVLIGIYLGCYFSIEIKSRLFILLGLIFSILLMVYTAQENVGIPYLFGMLPSLLLLRSDVLAKYKLNIYSISSLMLGVYLVHFALILILLSFGISNYLLPFIVFPLSVLIIFSIKRLLPKKIYQHVI